MRAALLILGLALTATATAPVAAQCPPATPVQGAPPPAPLPVFPASNWWNLDISAAPVDPNSAAFITWIGPTKGLHPDFGGEEEPGSDYIYGIPYAIVDGSQEKLPVTFEVWDESDGVDMATGEGLPFYPIPIEAIDQAHWIEGGPPGTLDLRADSDRHLIMVDCSNRHLYELYNVWFDEAETQWYAYSGAFFDLDANERRPDTWTSADASGMAIFPGLVRYDEAADGTKTDLGHAIRMTTRDTNGYVFPASHDAGNGVGAPPLGARLRLKALVNGQDPALRTNDPIARRIMRTMQKYGMIIADNGSDMYFTGTFDTRWDNGILNPAFNLLKASDFEVIELGWNPPPANQPQLSIADRSVAEGDAGTKTMVFTVSLSQASVSDVVFDLGTANGTATAGADFVALSMPDQLIPAGQLSKNFSVTINGDTTVEPNESYTVNLSSPEGAGIIDGQAIGRINNDDGPTLTVEDASFAEGNNFSSNKYAVARVRLSQAAAVPVTFALSLVDGTASTQTDIGAYFSPSVTILPGNLYKDTAYTLVSDNTPEANETVIARISSADGASILDGQGTITILNDDGPTLSVSNASVVEGHSGTRSATFTVTLSQASAGVVGYSIATGSDSAAAGSDYAAKSLADETIAAGSTSKTFTVTINGDAAVEGNETYFVNLSGGVGATVLDAQGVGTIINDDGPTLSVSDAQRGEGESGQAKLVFTVRLSQATTEPVTFAIATANGTAVANGDYVARSITDQTIPAGQLTKAFPVNINGDTTVEANETFVANLVSTNGASPFDKQGVATILNDDGPTLSVSDVTATEGQSGLKTFTFIVGLSQVATAPVYFDITTTDGSALAGSDYIARALTGQNIPAGATSKVFGVSVRGDAVVEPDEALGVNVTNVTGPVTVLDAQAIGTISNDD